VRQTAIQQRSLALLLAAAGAGTAWYLAPGWEMWATAATLTVTGAIAVVLCAAGAALWRGSPHRRTVAAVTLFAGAILLLLDAAGIKVSLADPGPLPYELLLAAGATVSGIGVLLRRRGGRWLALAFGAAGALSSGLNLVHWIAADVVDQFGWALAIWTLGGLIVLASLVGLAGEDRLAGDDQVWMRRDPIVRWMRAATMTGIVASTMLLVYAWLQDGVVASLAAPATALAVFLAVGAVLAARGLVLGGVVLAIGAVFLAAMWTAVYQLTPGGFRIPGYYLIFWLPAALSGLLCAAALIRSRACP
jgi:hypothetical protein